MRLNYLETFRGLMAVWVVLFHGIGFIPYSYNHFIFHFINDGILPVIAFIFLSGFVTHILLDKKEKFFYYIKRRALRLFPIYILCFVISLCMLPLAKDVLQSIPFQNHKIGMRIWLIESAFNSNLFYNTLSHMGLVHGLFPNNIFPYSYTIMGQSWSLTLEWQFYLFIPVVYKVFIEKDKKIINFVLLTLFVLLMPFSYLYMNQQSFLPIMIHYFLVGFFMYYFYKRYLKGDILPILVYTLLIVILLSVFVNIYCGIVFVMFAFVLFLQKNNLFSSVLENKCFLYIGKISYSIYCVHMIVYYFLIYGLQILNIKNTMLYSMLVIIGGIAMTLFISSYTYKFIELKFINMGKKK